jgi:hypothetical protein
VGTPGAPAIIFVRGQFVGIEVKSEKGKLSPNQQTFRDALVNAGGWCETVRTIADRQRPNL